MTSEINPAEICSSVFQTRLPLESCCVLLKCEDSLVSKASTITNNHNQRLPTGLSSSSVSTTSNSNNNSSSPKMGSRRIFTPQFKLQVLESYRSDSDCKGNQRATARKYNIHRRQIQKWLQCESNLRSSVANINQNSVKHQFHNMSPNHPHHTHHQQLRQHLSTPLQPACMTVSSTVPSSLQNKANIGYSHHQHNHPRLPLDSACQTLAMNSLNVPSMPNITSNKGVLAANLAAAVAVAIASSSSTSISTTTLPPLRPTAINGAPEGGVGNNTVSTISSSLLHSHHHHQHHHHHFQLSPYTGVPAGAPVPVSVPVLPHHIAAPTQTHPLHHQHYHYNNLSSHTHPHAIPLSHQPSAFMPTTACLPVNVLSTVAATLLPAKATDTTPNKEIEDNSTNANAYTELCDPPQEITKIINKSTIALQTEVTPTKMPAAALLMSTTALSYMHDTEYECAYKGAMNTDGDRIVDANCKTAFQANINRYMIQENLETSMSSPMDLSLGSRKNSFFSNSRTELPRSSTQINDVWNDKTMYNSVDAIGKITNQNTDVVDLTFRKRKVVTTCRENEQSQKFAKCADDSIASDNKASFDEGVLNNLTQSELKDDDDDDVQIEIEVDGDAKHTSSKPIKLFKPYLLDDSDDVNENHKPNGNDCPSQMIVNEQREPIIWSNHPAFSNDVSRASSLHSPTNGMHTFPNGSPFFLTSKTSSPRSVLSTTSAPLLSPTSFSLRCPKGSPVSGYESSSSTCSEREDTYSVTENQSYSLDFQMHTVCQEKLSTLHKPIHIHEWLGEGAEAEKNVARASIALFA